MATEWQRYRLSWRLDSPLHIGYRTIGTIMRTRLWVPGRNIWGAVIEALAQAKGDHAYDAMRVTVNNHVRFEAWFLGPNPETLWLPQYTDRGLYYDAMPARAMQWLALGASVSTAIEHGAAVANEGDLFEVEYIAPRWLHAYENPAVEPGTPIWLVGHVWARSSDTVRLESEDIIIDGLSLRIYAQSLVIGGERAKGYGRLVEVTLHQQPEQRVLGNDPSCAITNGTSIPLLVQWQPQMQWRGQIEPIIGRTTTGPGAYGQRIEPVAFCWLPGSVCDETTLTLSLPLESPGIAVMAPVSSS